ncbi:hypothetical protein C0Q70_05392 [Pomacea canaliculata]|uniref:C-type lectin domain-containing protein n=1 Tax=Pomacea canaliculata TaxID=400727 RepID=A0A2T7PL31_POMCA|nr:hypothetical protein C0Q70_05392 [Pomacea canaliculata]
MTSVSDADSTWVHTAVSTEISRMTALLLVWSFITSVHVVADDIDWFWVDNHCYGVAKQTRKGNQFESFCKTGWASTVADISTLDALAESKEYSMVWVGAQQVQSGGAYQWTTTHASVPDGLWSSAAKKTEACVAMTKVKVSGDTTYRLQDWSCDNPFSYLCQSTEACGAAPLSSSSGTTRSTSAAAATNSVKSTTIQASSLSGTTPSSTSVASIITSKATSVVSSAATSTSTMSTAAAAGTIESSTSAVATFTSTFTSAVSVVNGLLGKDVTQPVLPEMDDQIAASTLSAYFEDKIKTIMDSFSDSVATVEQTSDLFCGMPLSNFQPVTEDELLKLVRRCRPTTSVDDPIPLVFFSSTLTFYFLY